MDLKVSLMIQVGSGWVELNDPDRGYELHKDTFSQRSVTHRKVEVESPWLEGTYTQRSLRNNIIESVAVYCTGRSPGDAFKLQRMLTDAFDQNQFRMRFQVEDHYEIWICSSADYTIESSQELMIAKTCTVKAQVPRLPKVMR